MNLLKKIGGHSKNIHSPSSAQDEKGGSVSYAKNSREAIPSPVLLVADAPTSSVLPLIKEAQSLRHFEVPVRIWISEGAAGSCGKHIQPSFVANHMPQGGFGHSPRVLVAACSAATLVKVALGLAEGLVAEAVIQALWQGIPVYANVSVLEQEENAALPKNAALCSLYANYRKKLEDMGIFPLERGQIVPTVSEALLATSSLVPEESVCTGGNGAFLCKQEPAEEKRVFITQKDVESRCNEGTLDVPWNAIVTAQAKDTMARYQLVLRRRPPPLGR